MRHPLDGNAIAADAHYDRDDEIGNEDGETCNRVVPPDEDAPRGYKPKPCAGVMYYGEISEFTFCDTCGEIGDHYDR